MMDLLELFNRTFYVLSFLVNSMLLVIIRYKSSKELGLYKNLLFIFVLNDLIYTNVHFATNPIVSIRGKIYFLFSANFPKRWIISAFTTIHSHSFILLSFHFIYRYIAVAKYQWLYLFRTLWFQMVFVLCFVLETIIWFCLLFFQWKTEPGTFKELMPLIRNEFPNLTVHGIATAHYWTSDNILRWRPFFGFVGFSSIMTFVLSIVIFCAVSIYRTLQTNIRSKRGHAIQRQLFYTLIVQFSVPFLLMYMPVLLVITPSLLHISIDLPFRLMPSFFVPFPFVDALVILIGVRDYRMVLYRAFRRSANTNAIAQATTYMVRMPLYSCVPVRTNIPSEHQTASSSVR